MDCAIAGCASRAHKRGWCQFHYDRFRRFGDPLGGGPRRRSPGTMSPTCVVAGCGKRAKAFDLCSMHYSRKRLHGDADGGKWHQDGRSKEWRKDAAGYVYKWEPMSIHATKAGHVYQHRELMGEMLGRRLLPSESVHHKNGNRSDNRLENLELWVKAQPAGQRVTELVEYARQILQRYESVAEKLADPPPLRLVSNLK